MYTDEPDAAWTNFDDGDATATLIDRTGSALNAARTRKVNSLTQSVESLTAQARSLAEELKTVQARLSTARAELREVESLPPVAFDEGAAAKDIEFIKSLPGVLGLRVRDGQLAVHVRTGIDYDGWHYDFGDYEIRLDHPDSNYLMSVYCTRGGCFEYEEESSYHTRRCGDRYCNECRRADVSPRIYHTSALYWSPNNRDQVGSGSFCFGDRRSLIDGMLREGRYAEAVHVIIDCLNSVNDSDYYLLSECFMRRPLPGTEVPSKSDPEPTPETDEVSPVARNIGRRLLDNIINW